MPPIRIAAITLLLLTSSATTHAADPFPTPSPHPARPSS